MNSEQNEYDLFLSKYIVELLKDISNPYHKRLIESYQGTDPLVSMENELRKIISEEFQSEN